MRNAHDNSPPPLTINYTIIPRITPSTAIVAVAATITAKNPTTLLDSGWGPENGDANVIICLEIA